MRPLLQSRAHPPHSMRGKSEKNKVKSSNRKRTLGRKGGRRERGREAGKEGRNFSLFTPSLPQSFEVTPSPKSSAGTRIFLELCPILLHLYLCSCTRALLFLLLWHCNRLQLLMGNTPLTLLFFSKLTSFP